MELERLVAALAPEAVLGSPDPVEVRDLAYDARVVTPGAAFFCVPGERADGHDFAGQAVENGAVALVVERAVEPEVPQLVVPDARAAMATAADIFFDEPTRELEVAGVTGTSGKTTSAFLLYAVLEAAGRSPGLLGTVESRVGGEVRPVNCRLNDTCNRFGQAVTLIVVPGSGKQFDLGMDLHLVKRIRHLDFIEVRESAPIALMLGFLLHGQVIYTEYHILGRGDDRLAIRRFEQILGGQHELACFLDCLLRKRNMDSHLVTVEVRVEGGGDKRVQLNG